MATDYLLDTNIIVALIRDNQLGKFIQAKYNLRAFISQCMISVVTVGEMEKLGREFKWETPRLTVMRNFLNQLIWIDINDQAIFAAYAEIDYYSDTVGNVMGKNDAWIAATAKASGATLLTTDLDFDHLHPTHLTRIWIDPTSKNNP